MRYAPWLIVAFCWACVWHAEPGLATALLALTAAIESLIACWFLWKFWQSDTDPARIRWDGKVLTVREQTRKANRNKARLNPAARLRPMHTGPGAL